MAGSRLDETVTRFSVRIEADRDGETMRPGCGVIVGAGSVATSLHVVVTTGRGLFDPVTVLRSASRWGAEIGGFDARREVALLDVDGLETDRHLFRSSADLRLNERVFVAGLSEDLEPQVSEGEICALERSDLDHRYESFFIRTTAHIADGWSGSGLFDAKHRLIGIVGSADAEGRAMAGPAEWLAGLRGGLAFVR